MPCAASPPSAFCQEKVSDIDLVPGDRLGEHGRGGVDEGEALAVGRDPVAVGHAHAGGGAVPGEEHVAAEIDWARSGSLPYSALRTRRSSSLSCLVTSVTQPSPKLSQASASTPRCAQHGPHGHLEGAGVGGGHDGAHVARRQAQQRLGLVDGELQARLAFLGAVRAAEERVVEGFEGPAGALGAGAGGEMDIGRPLGRLGGGGHGCLPFQIAAPRWGGVSRRRLWRRGGGKSRGRNRQ